MDCGKACRKQVVAASEKHKPFTGRESFVDLFSFLTTPARNQEQQSGISNLES